MSPEEQREIWLKRILPALAIMVIYFMFISGFVNEDTDKAKQQYQTLSEKGISYDDLPELRQQQGGVTSETAKLQREYNKIHAEIKKDNGFLSRNTVANETIARIVFLLERHNLKIIEEKHHQDAKFDALSKSLRDTGFWIKGTVSDEQANMQIMEIFFYGSYIDTYHLLTELSGHKYKVLPVSLEMHESKNNGSQVEWTLKLWI